ncbi:MAG: DUF2892 domain-containing protein [Proteobacteria bacterium]|nr:DUF2892 domain-containing protein [Pseudomonadota bacterium]
MKANVGGIDRGLRIVAGLAILALFFVLEGANRWWALVGLVPLVTGIVGRCPAYGIFGIRTCRTG